MVYRGDRGFHSDVIFTQKVSGRKVSSNRFPFWAQRRGTDKRKCSSPLTSFFLECAVSVDSASGSGKEAAKKMLTFVLFLLGVVLSVSQVTEAPVLVPTSTAGVLKMGRFQVRLSLLGGSVCVTKDRSPIW